MKQDWTEEGARSYTEARHPEAYVAQHVAPLLHQRTRSHGESSESEREKEFASEEDFWKMADSITFQSVRLRKFRLSDWFPRTPGVYWSRRGTAIRESTYRSPTVNDPKLGRIFAPEAKMSLIEEGGIGTIRLRPRRIDETDCWFATAVKGTQCAGGIPLLIPNRFLRENAIEWGNTVDIVGTVRYLQDANLDDVAAHVHHASPAIIFVEKIQSHSSRTRSGTPVTLTPVALFDQSQSDLPIPSYRRPTAFGYTFVHTRGGSDDVDDAAEWIELYAKRHGGKVITNFDERTPILADAPLSYQRLVSRTYEVSVINNFQLSNLTYHIDASAQYNNYGQAGAIGQNARSDGNLFQGGRTERKSDD
jgi:hypothetical protein